jgi:double-stranded uracil-DNA glycosylase
MKFSRAELQEFKGHTLPDLIPQRTRLLFVGINPGPQASSTVSIVRFAQRSASQNPA